MSDVINIRQHPRFNEAHTPTYWCEGCWRERVPFDPFRPRQLCDDCEREATGVTPPEAA